MPMMVVDFLTQCDMHFTTYACDVIYGAWTYHYTESVFVSELSRVAPTFEFRRVKR
jgi:hypothetical protein